MTTTEYLEREIARTRRSLERAEKKQNTQPEELNGLKDKLAALTEAAEAVKEHWDREHKQRGWTAGEPLTVEQLWDMEGKPVLLKSPWWTEWCIVREHGEHEIAGDAISFTRRHYGEVCLGLSDYGKTWTAYAYQTAHIDLEKWTAEWVDNDHSEEMMCKCSKCWYPVSYFWGKTAFCPGCGRAMTPEAWAEMENRLMG